MDENRGELKLKDVRRRFDRAAPIFDTADFVHRAGFAGLVERLRPVRISPAVILDLGSATGQGSRVLAKTYRRSRVISFDVSCPMLRIARKKKPLLSRQTELLGDAMQLPLRSGSIDLVFCNLLLPWIVDLPGCFAEVARVLKKGGVFAFSTLGPDSFRELAEGWRHDDDHEHVNRFPDMHDVGDALVRARLADPVLDIDPLTVTYRDSASLYRDLTSCGARNCLARRRKTLTGKRRFDQAEQALSARIENGKLPLTLEMVYGHAWGTGAVTSNGEFRVDPATIGRRRRG